MFNSKNKMFCKIMCFLLLLFQISGCGNNELTGLDPNSDKTATLNTEDGERPGNTPSLNYPDTLKITRCLYFGDTGDNPNLKEELMDVFYKKTGINLEVISPPRNNYMEKVNLMITSSELDGLVNFFAPSDIMQAIENDIIEPLDDYLKDNTNWNSMPVEYRNIHKYDGKIYAVSAGYEDNFFSRSFRKDWLDNLGLDVPETVDDLFEVAKAFTEKDPDQNGIDDTVGLTSSWLWNIQDIFKAFDAMLNNTGDSPIYWDPITGVWQDSMLKPEMADALSYIKKLYSLGYLDSDFLTDKGSNMREKLWTGKAGSSFYWAMHGYEEAALEMRNTIPSAKWVEVPAIKGKRKEQLNCLNKKGLMYVLVKGTKQPKETVNTFINALFNREKYFMLKYGIQNKTFKMENNNVIILTDPNTGKPYQLPGIIGEMPLFNKFIYPVFYEDSREQMGEVLNFLEIESSMIQQGLYDNLFFVNCEDRYDSPISKEYSLKSTSFIKVFETEVAMAILGEKTIENALDDYRRKMRELGADRVLKEANDCIGKEPNQKY